MSDAIRQQIAALTIDCTELIEQNRKLESDRDRLHRILTHIANRGIQTDTVTARIWMSEANMKHPLLEVLEEAISKVT